MANINIYLRAERLCRGKQDGEVNQSRCSDLGGVVAIEEVKHHHSAQTIKLTLLYRVSLSLADTQARGSEAGVNTPKTPPEFPSCI